MRSSSIQQIVNAHRKLLQPIQVSGLSISSAQAYFLAQWVTKDLEGSKVILCPDSEKAEELTLDLQALLSILSPTHPSQVLYLPTWDHSPYSSVAPSLKVRHQRISVLHQINSSLKPIIITTLAASYQTTIPPSVFRDHSQFVKVGDSIESRDVFCRSLLQAGYLEIDPVEDIGTYAVRGEIIDLFPPGQNHPIRIELFGDEVEKIRQFNRDTQRTFSENQFVLNEIHIPPCREVLLDEESRLRENLKSFADKEGISRKVRDPILESIRDGHYPDHSDTWASFAYPAHNFWDFVKDQPQIIWVDELTCRQNFDQFLEKQKAFAEESKTSNLVIPPPQDLYPQKGLDEKNNVFILNSVEFTDLSSHEANSETHYEVEHGVDDGEVKNQHRASIRSNESFLTKNLKTQSKETFHLIQEWIENDTKIYILSQTKTQTDRLRFLFNENENNLADKITILEKPLSSGFRWPTENIAFLTSYEILGTGKPSRRRSSSSESDAAKNWVGLQSLSDLKVEDYVVHIQHGIGRYQGLKRLELSGAPNDFLLIEYANQDRFYLPIYRLNQIQKYVGGTENVRLDRLGSQSFEKTKQKVKESVKKLAIDLVGLYAKRSLQEAFRFTKRDSFYSEFENLFPFQETSDQIKSIEDVFSDVESGKMMDRLICGDVGFGKTEVALRAAFQAVQSGKQVAVLVPTTILALQHEQTFKERFKDFPIRIEGISRFRKRKEQAEIIELAKKGRVDILIGTHRLLSNDVGFKNLGLVIVDEEHRFGVEHKEKLKSFRINTHFLTLTATPIPRTLHMALSGLRDISIMSTPPVERLPIRTYVSQFDEALIKRAIEFELSRGGQVFFLHNRVQSIQEIATRISELVPSSKVGVGHGKMSETQLEKVMLDFYHKEYNVLVCTTIIEAGLDIPSANTIIINRADTFGLAQLYQLRGRVGRGDRRAYAYLLVSASGRLSDEAKKRLEVIQRFVELGSGFNIASHDLEIRGGGNLLGAEQSGQVAAVGFDLYTELLEEAIQEVRNEKSKTPKHHNTEKTKEPEIKTPYSAFLDKSYIPDVRQRLSLYRKLSSSENEEELTELEAEITDRYGKLPKEAENLLWMIRIKHLLKIVGIEGITVGKDRVSILPGPHHSLDSQRILGLVSKSPDQYKITPQSKLIAKISSAEVKDLYFSLISLVKQILSQNKSLPSLLGTDIF